MTVIFHVEVTQLLYVTIDKNANLVMVRPREGIEGVYSLHSVTIM